MIRANSPHHSIQAHINLWQLHVFLHSLLWESSPSEKLIHAIFANLTMLSTYPFVFITSMAIFFLARPQAFHLVTTPVVGKRVYPLVIAGLRSGLSLRICRHGSTFSRLTFASYYQRFLSWVGDAGWQDALGTNTWESIYLFPPLLLIIWLIALLFMPDVSPEALPLKTSEGETL